MKKNYILMAATVLALATIAVPVAAEQGYVETINRQRFTGGVAILSGAFEVANTNDWATNRIHITEVRSVCFTSSKTNSTFQRGVLLVNGTRVAAKVETADDTALRFPKSLNASPVPMHRVARILLRSVAEEQLIPPSRRGLLLRNNDFVDGEFKALKDGRIRIESVLFGAKTFQASDVSAIILRNPEPGNCRYEVRTRDNSSLRASDVTVAKNELAFSEPILGTWRVRPSELLDFKRNDIPTP